MTLPNTEPFAMLYHSQTDLIWPTFPLNFLRYFN